MRPARPGGKAEKPGRAGRAGKARREAAPAGDEPLDAAVPEAGEVKARRRRAAAGGDGAGPVRRRGLGANPDAGVQRRRAGAGQAEAGKRGAGQKAAKGLAGKATPRAGARKRAEGGAVQLAAPGLGRRKPGAALPAKLAAMAALVGGEAAFNHAVHVWEDPGFIFLSNPICACSTLKMSLNLSVAQRIGRTDFRIETASVIHNRAENLLKTPRQVGYGRFAEMLEDDGVPLFAFVRSPESRFLSAFRKKLARESAFTRRVRQHLGVGPDLPLQDFLTLEQFAAGVARDAGLRDLDPHWRAQHRQVFFDLLPRTRFGFVESFQADVQPIFTQIFGAGGFVIADATALNPANASANRKQAAPTLSDAGQAFVAQAYAGDLAMLETIRARRAAS